MTTSPNGELYIFGGSPVANPKYMRLLSLADQWALAGDQYLLKVMQCVCSAEVGSILLSSNFSSKSNYLLIYTRCLLHSWWK